MLLKVMKDFCFLLQNWCFMSIRYFEGIITVCRVLLDSWRFASIISWNLSNSGRLCFELLTPYFIRSVNFSVQMRTHDRIRTSRTAENLINLNIWKARNLYVGLSKRKRKKKEMHDRKEKLQTAFGGQFSCDSNRQVNKHKHCSLWKASKTLTGTSEFNMGILLRQTSVHWAAGPKSHVSNVSTRVSADLPASPAR